MLDRPKIKRNLKRLIQGAILAAARVSKLDLTRLAFYQEGIGLHHDSERNGEKTVVLETLSRLFGDQGPDLVYDVGANRGLYSRTLLQCFPCSTIHLFEPNIALLEEFQSDYPSSPVHDIAVSSAAGEARLYVPSSGLTTQATLIEAVARKFEERGEGTSFSVQRATLDDFASAHGHEHIDFLKLDIEGHEFDALEGAQRLINGSRIKVIQFELNECSVHNRRFLKDFFELLWEYEIYRVAPDTLLPLGCYRERYETFLYQNIVAISKRNYPEQSNQRSYLDGLRSPAELPPSWLTVLRP